MPLTSHRMKIVLLLAGAIVAGMLIVTGSLAGRATSTDRFCQVCHVHPHAVTSWKKSGHYDNPRGIVVHCTECHLPPGGYESFREKARMGIRDLYGKWFRDLSQIDWEARSSLEHAAGYTFESSCIRCHENLFPLRLSKEGELAHFYYSEHRDEIRCINCHLHTGHYDPDAIHAKNVDFGMKTVNKTGSFASATRVDSFADFTEHIPGTPVSFEMVAVPGGSFMMGSPGSEPFREPDEGPVHEVSIDRFYLGRFEVSWDEYQAFFSQTAARGRSSDTRADRRLQPETDAITGPTPPWGDPSQGWGQGKQPAITMTHHAAMVYCEWLSSVTGKRYRLPTEAEWEYACRAGTRGPYFFEADPKRIAGSGLFRRADTSVIASYAVYLATSPGRTQEPGKTKANPFGLVNMPGNVAEFCLDTYDPGAYSHPAATRADAAPSSGTAHVIRGGSFRDQPGDLRSAARDHTRQEEWQKTDPQMPKSLWWYSDCQHVGFRVVCEYDENTGKK